MAPFAPTVPSPNIAATSDPEYTSYRWSRPIGPYEGNKSSEIAFKGGAEALTGAVHASDSIIKHGLESGIEQDAGAARDAWGAELDQTLAAVRGQGATTNTEGDKKLDILTTPPKEDSVPKDVKDIGKVLAQWDARKANGNVSDSQYRGVVDSLAKKYRAQWPGYTKEIDETFDQVTERGVANKFIQSKVAELNSYAAAARESHNKFETLAMEGIKNIPGFETTASLWRANRISDDAMAHKYNQGMSWKFDEERAGSALKVAEAGTKLEALAAERYVKTTADGLGKGILSTVGSVLDVPGGMDKLNSQILKGEIDPQHAEMYAQQLRALLEQGKAKMRSQFNEKDEKGRSAAQKLPEGALEKLIDDNQYIRGIQSTLGLLDSKETGLATRAQRLLQIQAENDHWQAANEHTETGVAVRSLDAMKGLDPAVRKIVENNVSGLAGLSGYFSDKFNALYATQGVLGKSDPEVVTYNHAIEEGLKNGLNDPVTFKRIFSDGMSKIADANTPTSVKLGYMLASFNPPNLGILNKVEPDHTDAQGNKVPGKVWLYNQFTNPGIASEVDRVATATNRPDLRDKYRDFVEKEGQQIIASEIPKASNYIPDNWATKAAGAVKDFFTPPEDADHIQVTYDNINHAFKVEPKNKPSLSMSQSDMPRLANFRRQQTLAQESVDKINTVMRNMAAMSEIMHTNPDADIYSLLQSMGTLTPLTDKMLEAMKNTIKIKEEPKK